MPFCPWGTSMFVLLDCKFKTLLNKLVPSNNAKEYGTEHTCLKVMKPKLRCLPLLSFGIFTLSSGPAYKTGK